ncbi:MAG: thiamine pyrophosphate-dependent dehydrogenase E1 component subunit alpha [Chloroflexi bacterium]|nr:thiamine pyrophosphate-dependent dehydrogenase E1 component subunit alpha [Chloroflexota bacterium]
MQDVSTATQTKLKMLRTMWLIRAFEERVSELHAKGDVVGLLHLGIGQEGIAVGVCDALRDDDYVYTGHRGDAYFIAKGADVNRLMAEMAGRSTGYCQGKGGSMHMVAVERGLLGATGIVGGSLPLGLGSAFACREKGKGQVVAVSFGDGASNAGVFHETLNIASLWKLPLIFVCENNGYAEFTPMSAATVIERLVEHAKPYGIPSQTVDGNDLFDVQRAMQEAVDRARAGEGPTFLECLTYRLRGHYVGDPEQYRQLSEVAEWKEKDPIARFIARIREDDQVSEAVLSQAEAEARQRIDEATRFALDSPWPDPQDTATLVYA